jgi:hypothetical protein
MNKELQNKINYLEEENIKKYPIKSNDTQESLSPIF